VTPCSLVACSSVSEERLPLSSCTLKKEAVGFFQNVRLRLKCDGTRADTKFHLSAKWTSPFKSAGASVLSTTGSRGVGISGSNAGYTMLRGSVKSTGYPLYSPVFPSLPLPCVTVCHHISTGLYWRVGRSDGDTFQRQQTSVITARVSNLTE
jgi:hypothetical protein